MSVPRKGTGKTRQRANCNRATKRLEPIDCRDGGASVFLHAFPFHGIPCPDGSVSHVLCKQANFRSKENLPFVWITRAYAALYGVHACQDERRHMPSHVTAKICSHRRVRVEISTRTRWFFLCWKFVIFHAKFMCGVSPYPTQPLFALPLHHWVPLQTLPTVGRLLPLQSVPKTILNFPKPCFQIVL